MSPVGLGILLGVTNVIANALLFGALDDPRAVGFVFVYGILPGIIAGTIIGALASISARCSRWLRHCVLMGTASFGVFCLGAMFDAMDFVPYSLVPTLALTGLLEWRTYVRWPDPAALDDAGEDAVEDAADAAARELDPYAHVVVKPRSAVPLAMLLGALVMLVALAGAGIDDDGHLHWLFDVYLPWGAGCGAALAVPFGVVADGTRTRPIWLRRTLLLAGGLALTTTLGWMVHMTEMVPVAFIPVAAGCLVLERYSRAAEVVPVAVARV